MLMVIYGNWLTKEDLNKSQSDVSRLPIHIFPSALASLKFIENELSLRVCAIYMRNTQRHQDLHVKFYRHYHQTEQCSPFWVNWLLNGCADILELKSHVLCISKLSHSPLIRRVYFHILLISCWLGRRLFDTIGVCDFTDIRIVNISDLQFK